jgi:hypothetical protein
MLAAHRGTHFHSVSTTLSGFWSGRTSSANNPRMPQREHERTIGHYRRLQTPGVLLASS